MMNMPSDLRRFLRAPLGLAVLFTTKEDPESVFIEGVARDISLGGMFVETSIPASFGVDVVVHLRLPGNREVSQIAARVRWTTQDGMGLQLGSLGARETLIITEIVRQHEEDRARDRVACTD